MKQILLTLITLTLFINSQYAQDIWGGAITYTNTGDKQYIVKNTLYYNCFKTSPSNLALTVRAGNKTQNINMSLANDDQNYALCNANLSNACNTDNGSRGTRKSEFTAVLDFNSTPLSTLISGECNVYFSYEYSNRLSSITTLNPSEKFYIESSLNLCSSTTISSPQINYNPIFQSCCNSPTNISPNFSGIENFDSVSYELINAKTSSSQNVTYNGNYSGKYPFLPYCPPNNTMNCAPLPNAKPPRGLYFSKLNGSLILTPTNCNEFGVMSYLINFFKYNSSNVLVNIGSVQMETCLKIESCTNNNPPSITAKESYVICEGDKIQFNVDSKDDQYLPNQTTADTLTLTMQSNIPNSTFTISNPNAREKSGQFSWNSTIGDARPNPYHITFKAIDNNCNYLGITTKSILLYVNEKPKKQVAKSLQNNVLKVNYLGKKTNTFKLEIINDSNQTINSSTQFSDSFTFVKKGKYYLKYTIISAGCSSVYFDTLSIANNLNIKTSIKSQYKLYPNPITTNNLLMIDLGNNNINSNILIWDSNGRKIDEIKTEETKNFINLKNIAPGLYLIQYNNEFQTLIIQ